MILGCNYWASNAGTEMWRNFDERAIRDDLRILASHGVKYLRVFPNWRDFQPVEPLYTASGTFKEYRMTDGSLPKNRYYLDEQVLERFRIFCDICGEFDLKVIVGLVTGWMSLRLFVPPALYGRDLFTDPIALYFEQLLVMGIVERFKYHSAIYAWDHGNECHCMGSVDNHFVSASWIQMISNAVYSVDRTRPLISGINTVRTDGNWRIDEQSAVCDMMVTHPYPFWTRYAGNDKNTYIKSTLLPTVMTKLYTDIGKKPCFIEEFGTMGPGVCSEELAGDVLRVNYFSSLANGNPGILWWCANEQTELTTPPYTWTMVENELGMIYQNREPKPVLLEMKRLSELNFELPPASIDAVCLLTEEQDCWGVAYMSYVLAKQAGLNISFADATKEIPDAKVYMLPSINGNNILPKELYLKLKEKVSAGAKLYISQDTGFLSDFEGLTGNKITDSALAEEDGILNLNGKEIRYHRNRKLYLENTRAEQVKTPLITRAAYGEGEVYYVGFPAEAMLIGKSRAFDGNVSEIYREVFKDELSAHAVRVDNENVALTLHEDGGKLICVAVNHAEEAQNIEFISDYPITRILYGTLKMCPPMDAVIVEFEFGGGVHFNSKSLRTPGKRYFEAYREAAEGK